ncbi:hypothetical protein ADIMK_2645 [Marinobacterium lacunae]|uniref:Uncharacterized protein n=2 Tax=Marinobacterium lacunae TaxID=1232683 RepID=A0A081FX66_9GAMM|nr:hypothetical protein ADIMK_2645 [Marinobacterium lacunae]
MGYEAAKAKFFRNEAAADEGRQVSDEAVSASPVFETPPDLLEIQKLLDGKHVHQAEQLALALKAWLGVSHLYKQNLGSAASPKGDVVEWLNDNASELGKTQQERIASLVNWDKSGGRPTTGK